MVPEGIFAAENRNSQVSALLDEATRLRSFGQRDAAIQKYEEANRFAPEDEEITRNLGILYFESSDYAKAILFLERALSKNPNDPYIHLYLAESHSATGQTDLAESEYRQALQLNPDLTEAQYGLGLILESRGETQKALEYYRSVASKNPNHAGAFFQIGSIAYRQNNLKEAAEAFEQAALADPNMVSAHYNLGLVLTNLGNLEKAREEFKRAIMLDPSNALAFFQISQTYELQGFRQEAARGYQEALKLNPNFTEARNRLMSIQQGDPMGGEYSENRMPQRQISLFSGSFGKGGFQTGSPLDQLGGLSGTNAGNGLNSKALLIQLGSTLLNQWMNARRQAQQSQN